jgi:hypothetical protein
VKTPFRKQRLISELKVAFNCLKVPFNPLPLSAQQIRGSGLAQHVELRTASPAEMSIFLTPAYFKTGYAPKRIRGRWLVARHGPNLAQRRVRLLHARVLVTGILENID